MKEEAVLFVNEEVTEELQFRELTETELEAVVGALTKSGSLRT